MPTMGSRPATAKARALMIVGTALGTLVILSSVTLAMRALWSATAKRTPGLPESSTPPPLPEKLAGSTDDILPPARVETDSDQDGLPDTLESLYGTDPRVADTDGDGYIDGREVANGYDPIIPSPHDKIGATPRPSPLGSPPAASPLPDLPTSTERFLSEKKLPATKAGILGNNEALRDFVNEENTRVALPRVSPNEIRRDPGVGKEVIRRYLDAISIPQNARLARVDAEDITTAFTALTEKRDPAPLDDVLRKIRQNVTVLKETAVPEEALNLHVLYLTGTIALEENTVKLQHYATDFVGALVAASRISELRTTFEKVGNDIQSLEKKYNIS